MQQHYTVVTESSHTSTIIPNLTHTVKIVHGYCILNHRSYLSFSMASSRLFWTWDIWTSGHITSGCVVSGSRWGLSSFHSKVHLLGMIPLLFFFDSHHYSHQTKIQQCKHQQQKLLWPPFVAPTKGPWEWGKGRCLREWGEVDWLQLLVSPNHHCDGTMHALLLHMYTNTHLLLLKSGLICVGD